MAKLISLLAALLLVASPSSACEGFSVDDHPFEISVELLEDEPAWVTANFPLTLKGERLHQIVMFAVSQDNYIGFFPLDFEERDGRAYIGIELSRDALDSSRLQISYGITEAVDGIEPGCDYFLLYIASGEVTKFGT